MCNKRKHFLVKALFILGMSYISCALLASNPAPDTNPVPDTSSEAYKKSAAFWLRFGGVYITYTKPADQKEPVQETQPQVQPPAHQDQPLAQRLQQALVLEQQVEGVPNHRASTPDGQSSPRLQQALAAEPHVEGAPRHLPGGPGGAGSAGK